MLKYCPTIYYIFCLEVLLVDVEFKIYFPNAKSWEPFPLFLIELTNYLEIKRIEVPIQFLY